MLETPPTIGLPSPEEFPEHPELIEGLEKRATANIQEGYVLHQNNTIDLPFSFYAEININNPGFWNVFTMLAEFLPDEISCIYNQYDEELNNSPYLDKKLMIDFLTKYKLELTQDCNLEFVLIYNTDEKLEEIFVSETKYIKVWSRKEELFRLIMKVCGIQEIPALNFIDEFPKTIIPLTSVNPNAKPTALIIKEMNSYFTE